MYVSIIGPSCKYKLYEVVVSQVVCASCMYLLYVLVICITCLYLLYVLVECTSSVY